MLENENDYDLQIIWGGKMSIIINLRIKWKNLIHKSTGIN